MDVILRKHQIFCANCIFGKYWKHVKTMVANCASVTFEELPVTYGVWV